MTSTKQIEIVLIDAFTSISFKGNPAAVCLMDQPGDEDWMKKIAREMNLSETAFLYPFEGGYHLRWLTPTSEVDLCGHGTLATAHMLYEDGHEPADRPIKFKTRVGWVSANKEDDYIILNFPVNTPEEIEAPTDLLDAIGAEASYVGIYPKSYLVELESDSIVRGLKPNLTALEKLDRPKVCVTAYDSSGVADFVSRLFAPAIGIPEDPVNGNSHTALTPYWSAKLGKETLISHYVSERGGEIKVKLDPNCVKISGKALTVSRSKIPY